MQEFAQWLDRTDLSLWIKSVEWLIPVIQTVHIIAIGVLMGSVILTCLRILARAGTDEAVVDWVRRFSFWFWLAFGVLAATGITLIIGEPVRQVTALSFWLKLVMLAVGVIIATLFLRSVRRDSGQWDQTVAVVDGRTRMAAFGVLLVWLIIIVLGRLIAFDSQFWGSLSPQS